MPRTIALPFLFIIAIAITFSACDCASPMKERAIGENDVITVIADSAVFEELRPALENAFGKFIFTPQREAWFRLRHAGIDGLELHKREKNILFLAPIDHPDPTASYLRRALDSTVQALVRNDSANVIIKRDVWYEDQLVMYLTGSSKESLENAIVGNADRLLYYFKNAWDERERTHMLGLSRESDIEERMNERYNWSLALIKGWFVGKDSAAYGSVVFRRQSPMDSERWVMVHWMDTTDTELLTSAFLLKKRNALTEVLYRTYDDKAWMTVDTTNHLQFDEVNFHGQFAIRMSGLWQMSDHSMGGPFISYLFYHEGHRRVYLLDGAVFAPRYEKKKLIQDVDIILQTFRTSPLRPS